MVSVIAVNHNSSDLLRACYVSIVTSVGNQPFEFIVVDSGSKKEDVSKIRNLKADNVQIILNSENIGYAKAINAGVQVSKGDYILITNPDIVYKPGSIQHMMHALGELPRCGAVGPKTWWNEKMTFLIPAGELITPFWFLKSECMRISSVAKKILLKGWIRKSLRYWLSEEPLKQATLSGGCIMTTKNVFRSVGGFDEAFHLYFEDTDWCLRVTKAGFNIYSVPGAEIVHYGNQSSKKDSENSQKTFERSLQIYIRKHFKYSSMVIGPVVNFLRRKHIKNKGAYNDMGIQMSPPVFSFEDDSKKLILLSPLEGLVPSTGSIFQGQRFEIPKDLWDYMGDGRYFAKVFDLFSFRDYGSWSWVKRGHE